MFQLVIFHGLYIVANQTQGLLVICASDTDVTKDPYSKGAFQGVKKEKN